MSHLNGSRTFSIEAGEPRMSTAWTSRYAQRTKGIKSSAIRELLKLTQRPDIISFAGGLPASDLFPTDRFRMACCRVLEQQAHLALQYGATEGYEPLRSGPKFMYVLPNFQNPAGTTLSEGAATSCAAGRQVWDPHH